MLVWTLLTFFLCFVIPSASFAQQPTATIRTMRGDVLVSGQIIALGAVLQAGDTIQVQAGASVVVELSDGSTLELGEESELTFSELTETPSG
jgi:hypothetical protein